MFDHIPMLWQLKLNFLTAASATRVTGLKGFKFGIHLEKLLAAADCLDGARPEKKSVV